MKGLNFLIPLLCLCLSGCQALIRPIAGDFDLDVFKSKKELSPHAKKLIDEAFEGLDPHCTVDFHVHAVGIGAKGTGAWVNPKMGDLFSPKKYTKYVAYMSASGITSSENVDGEYIDRLVNLKKSEPRLGRMLLFAFDYFHNSSGEAVPENSTFFIPNDYVIKIHKIYPKTFIPVASIHPYRKDALVELARVHKEGVRFIKWLPNAQHIDAMDERSIQFFKEMKKLDMTLITHTGHEKAVEGEEFQKLGNPLKFRKALDLGTKVIMAHFASLGTCQDLDSPGAPDQNCFSLFWRLMKEKRYEGLLYGETSALTLYTRIGEPLNKLLENPQMAKRFVHGSDYPLPAINILYRTGQYVDLGYLKEVDRDAMNEIYRFNPLLFNFVTKRKMRHPKTTQGMSNIIFHGKDLVSCLGKK
jgi:predicted TIM-barrel fold metal-dependent hydrolase